MDSELTCVIDAPQSNSPSVGLGGGDSATGDKVCLVRATGRPIVAPFARALALLASFTSKDLWCSGRELAARTGLPPSTAIRISDTLVQLGYLHYSPVTRGYRLAAPVVALGYGAIANSNAQRVARAQMGQLAEQQRVHVHLSSRDRLETVILESCSSSKTASSHLKLDVGTRLGLASSPLGLALLAALPEVERYYLLEHLERRAPRDWQLLRRRTGEGLSQVQRLGFCYSLGGWRAGLAMIALPVVVDGYAPHVLSCVGSAAQMPRARVELELGPRLVAMADKIRYESALA